MFSPLRLLASLLGLIVIGTPLAAVAVLLAAVVGSPGTCEAEDRPITFTPDAAASFQTKWDQLNATLNAGQVSTVVFDESEVTSRARLWLEERDAPVSDLLVCFSADGGSASGKVDIPFFPGDVDVLVRGTLDLTGTFAVADIDEIEIGGLPGPLADLVKRFVEDLIEDDTTALELAHDYGLAFAEGEATVSGQP